MTASPAGQTGTPECGPVVPVWVGQLLEDAAADGLPQRVVEADLAAAFDYLSDNEQFVATLSASVEENVAALCAVATGRIALDAVNLAQPRRLAALQAQLSVPQTSLQLSYRVGFLTIWRDWSQRIELSDRPPDERAEALRLVTELVFAYQNAALMQVAAEHVQTEAARQRSRDHVRHRLVRELLAGSLEPDSADLVTLGYDLSADHLAVSTPTVAESGAEWVRRLRAAGQVRETLRHVTGDGVTIWWFARPSWSDAARRRLIAQLRADGQCAEVSAPAPGLDGFRDTYAQLRAARRVRVAWQRGAELEAAHGIAAAATAAVLPVEDVRIEAMFLADIETTTQFVLTELGPLAGLDRPAVALRETLRCWLELRSHVAVAHELGLHEHTVRNRIHRIEQLLAHPISGRYSELVLALRLRPLVIGVEPAQIVPPALLSTSRARRLASSA